LLVIPYHLLEILINIEVNSPYCPYTVQLFSSEVD
jgi:hypothetical protein